MLLLSEITLRRGTDVLFERASCQIHRGYRVGIVGANGCGKSSLLALIRRDIDAEHGEIDMPTGIVMASVAQETPASEQLAIDYVLDGDIELRLIEADIRAAEADERHQKLAELYAQLESIGGYDAGARASRLLQGLGFNQQQQKQPVRTFSGGWRMRLNLAQALICRSDLLMLDEPTNHLDLDAVLWLEDWLKNYPGTLLLISHDRDFLDNIVDHVLHIEQRRVQFYTGNYSSFETMRAEALAQQQAAFNKQQREVKHIQEFIDRFKAKASKAKQAQSRLKALQRMERIAPAHVDSSFGFQFRIPDKLPNPLLKIEQADVGYEGTTILSSVDLNLMAGQRIGILGRNGAGKSTLMQLLAGQLPVQRGHLWLSPNLKVGYFAQHQLEQLHLDRTALQHLLDLDPRVSDTEHRRFLGGFGFSEDKTLSPVKHFSGGEKARLVLALIVYQKPNLLLLDEPTNHLDLDMRLALLTALQEFDGSLIIVSHDRYLLNAVTEEFLLVADGQVTEFDGDLEDYRLLLKNFQANKDDEPRFNKTVKNVDSRKQQRQQQAELRRQLQPMKKQLQRLEQHLEQLNQQKDSLHAELSDQSLYDEANKTRLEQVLKQQASVEKEIEFNEDQWMALIDQIDGFQAQADHVTQDTQ